MKMKIYYVCFVNTFFKSFIKSPYATKVYKPTLYRLAVLVSSKGRTRPLKRVSIVTQLVTVNP